MLREMFIALCGREGHDIIGPRHCFDSQVEVASNTTVDYNQNLLYDAVKRLFSEARPTEMIDIPCTIVTFAVGVCINTQGVWNSKYEEGLLVQEDAVTSSNLGEISDGKLLNDCFLPRFVEAACLLLKKRVDFATIINGEITNAWSQYEDFFMMLFTSNCRVKHLRMLLPLHDNLRLTILALLVVGSRSIINDRIIKTQGRLINSPMLADFGGDITFLDNDGKTLRYLASGRLNDSEKKRPLFTTNAETVVVHVIYGEHDGFSLRLPVQDWFKHLRTEYEHQTGPIDGVLVVRDIQTKLIYHAASSAPIQSITVDALTCSQDVCEQSAKFVADVYCLRLKGGQWMATFASQVKTAFPTDYRRAYRLYMAMLESPDFIATVSALELAIEEKQEKPVAFRPTTPERNEEEKGQVLTFAPDFAFDHSPRSPLRSPTPCPRPASDSEESDTDNNTIETESHYMRLVMDADEKTAVVQKRLDATTAELMKKQTETVQLQKGIDRKKKQLEKEQKRGEAKDKEILKLQQQLEENAIKWQESEKEKGQQNKKVVDLETRLAKLHESHSETMLELANITSEHKKAVTDLEEERFFHQGVKTQAKTLTREVQLLHGQGLEDLTEKEFEHQANWIEEAFRALCTAKITRAIKLTKQAAEADIKQAVETSQMCYVCMAKPWDCAPKCGHLICNSCVGQLKKPQCPKCSAAIVDVRKLFV